MVKGRLRTSIIIAVWFVLTAIWNIVSVFTGIHHIASFSYMALTLFWTFSLRKDIVEPHIRKSLQAGGVMLFLLFALRFLRYNLDIPYETVYRLLWYAYYIPFITLPFLSFSASINIGGTNAATATGSGISDFISRKDIRRNKKLMLPLTVVSVLMCILMLTNDQHELAMRIRYTDSGYDTTYRFFYYIIIVWYALLGLLAFVIMIRRCRVSSYKRYIALPVVVESIGILLWVWYYVKGGSSPRIMGISLYNIQEVFLLQFIGMWESCIAIGLVPSRSLIAQRDWIKRSILDSIYDEYASAKEYYKGLWKKDEDEFREGLISIACLGAYAKRRSNLELIADSRGNLSTTELSLAIRETFDYHELAGLSTGYEESGKAEVPALLIIYAYELFEKIIQKARSACYVKVYAGQTADAVSFRMIVEADTEEDAVRQLDPTAESADGNSIETVGKSKSDGGKGFIAHAISDMGAPEAIGASITVREEDETEIVELNAEYPLKRSAGSYFGSFRKTVNTAGSFDKKNQRTDNASDHERNRDVVYTAEHGLAGIAEFLSLEDEALKVKTWIHDSLGRCLLMTKRYILCPGEVERDALYRAWSRTFAGIAVQVGLVGVTEKAATGDGYSAAAGNEGVVQGKGSKESSGYAEMRETSGEDADYTGNVNASKNSIDPDRLKMIYEDPDYTGKLNASENSLDPDRLKVIYKECFDQARSMGVNVIVRGAIPQDPRYLEIIDTAISVHVTNVSGHTTGDEAYITATQDAEAYTLVFENNGESKELEVRETGGLRNLRRQTEAAGGTMVIESKPRFRMTLRFVR